MKAIILATAEINKLAPLTDHLATPLLPILNRPIVELVVEKLVRAGIKDIWISLHHLSGSIEAYLGDGKRWGARINYSLQRQPLGTAGALKWAQAALDETFVVMPGDAVIDFNIAHAIEFHRRHQATATSIVHSPLPNTSAMVHLDAHNTLSMQEPHELALTGAFIFEPAVLAFIPARTQYAIQELVADLGHQNERVVGFETMGFWNSLGTFSNFQTTQDEYLASLMEQPPRIYGVFVSGKQYAPGIWVGRNPVIHPTAKIAAPVVIGDDCFIGKDTEIGPSVVIGNNVIIDDQATLHNCTILNSTFVGKLVNIENRLVSANLMIDTQTGTSIRVADNFLLAANTPLNVGVSLIQIWDRFSALVLAIALMPVFILVGLASLICAGTIIARVPCYGVRPGDSQPTTFNLFRFATHRTNQTSQGLGYWLERLGLDRLFEWWNIARGDLAWVGVAPITPAQAASITEDWQRERFQSPVGWTGLWFTSNVHHTDLDNIFVADTYYVAVRNRRENLGIIWRTPLAWWQRAIQSKEI